MENLTVERASCAGSEHQNGKPHRPNVLMCGRRASKTNRAAWLKSLPFYVMLAPTSDFILVRRSPEKPGTGVVFLTPLRGDKEISAAADLGFNVTNSVHSVRIEGENKPGIAAAITEKLAAAGINLRGFSAAVIGTQFIMYIGLDSESDAQKAIHTIREE